MVSPPGGDGTPAPVVLTRWPIYVRDWLGSDTLRALSGDAEMLFVRMCLDQWEHGVCSPDEERWRSAHAHRCADWSRAWRQACALFVRSDAGLVNARVARDRLKAVGEISAKVRAAVETNAKRRNKPRKVKKADKDAERTLSVTLSERSPDAHPTLKPLSASASASSSVSESESPLPPGPDRVRATRAALAGESPPIEEPKPKAKSKPAAAPPSAFKHAQEHWCEVFRRCRRAPYLWAGAKDSHALNHLLELTKGDVAEIDRRADRFLADRFWGPKADFTKFAAQFNAMAGDAPAETNGKPYQHAFEKTGDAIDQVFGALKSRERTVDVETVRREALSP